VFDRFTEEVVKRIARFVGPRVKVAEAVDLVVRVSVAQECGLARCSPVARRRHPFRPRMMEAPGLLHGIQALILHLAS
jgi:hypothetical protein